MTQVAPGSDSVGWLLVSPSAIPDGWQARAIPMALIPLLPQEIDARLNVEADIPPRDEAKLLKLVAQGLSKRRIAEDLHMSMRTLDRRLQALREKFGAGSLTELAASAARRGFGSPPDSSTGHGHE